MISQQSTSKYILIIHYEFIIQSLRTNGFTVSFQEQIQRSENEFKELYEWNVHITTHFTDFDSFISRYHRIQQNLKTA